jgi:DNA-binding GntR family transcriptional regulator
VSTTILPLAPDSPRSLDGVSDANLRESILQRIRIGIVSGHIAPNELLTVPSLSKQLGVSTTPIREALLELSKAGLIEARRNRGFIVRATSPKELQDIFAIRAQLESFALSLIPGCTERDQIELNALAHEVETAVKQRDTVGYISADRAFHQALIALADNSKLSQMIMELRNNMRLYGIETQAGLERQERSVQEHYDLVKMIAAGNYQEASELLTSHILDWQPIFLSALECVPASG